MASSGGFKDRLQRLLNVPHSLPRGQIGARHPTDLSDDLNS
jgi:hypothetical protein